MPFILVQGGSSLYKVDPSTGTATTLTLPSGVTLSTTRKPKFAILNQFIVMVNSPSRNLMIDPEGVVRVLVPRPPASPPVLAAGSGTGVTGAVQAKQSFVIYDSLGNIISESPLSPASVSVTLADDDIAVTRVAVSEDSISARRVYRTGGGGTQYYHWIDLDGNVTTSFTSGLADAGLTALPVVPTILTAPAGTLPGSRLKNITSWKNRLWAVADDPDNVDSVVYTEDGKVYAWANSLTAYPKGQDAQGIVAFAARKDQLGILKRNGVWQITGSSNANFSVVQLTYGKAGCVAPDSVLVINDRAFWLGQDGVYEWSAEGVRKISEAEVNPWFTTDTYFNRSRFSNAFAKYNEVRNCYELHLAATGSSSEDRWVQFNLNNRKWYGPHKTAAFTPTHAAHTTDGNNLPLTLVGGSDGVLYVANQATYRDGTATVIDEDVYGVFHHGNAPDIEHFWGELSLLSKVESGGALTVTPTVGRLNSSAGTALSHSLTTGRERLGRLGIGAMVRLRFQQATLNQGAVIYGYEIPFHEIGRR